MGGLPYISYSGIINTNHLCQNLASIPEAHQKTGLASRPGLKCGMRLTMRRPWEASFTDARRATGGGGYFLGTFQRFGNTLAGIRDFFSSHVGGGGHQGARIFGERAHVIVGRMCMFVHMSSGDTYLPNIFATTKITKAPKRPPPPRR